MPRITYAGLTHQGRVRTQNEDRWTADPSQGLFIVSDGMGGQPAGALAARIVVEALPALLRAQMQGIDDLTTPDATHRLLSALAVLSEQVRSGSQGQPGLDGMGATVALALLRGMQALIAHMGDSRAYLVRRGCLEQLTTDHSLVQLLLDCGEITPDEAAHHPARGQLTRYIGMPGEPLPAARLLALCPGDRLLLCSDGLTGMVRDVKLLALLQKRLAPSIVCQRLVTAANAAGGTDNITALVVSVSRSAVRGRAGHLGAPAPSPAWSVGSSEEPQARDRAHTV